MCFLSCCFTIVFFLQSYFKNFFELKIYRKQFLHPTKTGVRSTYIRSFQNFICKIILDILLQLYQHDKHILHSTKYSINTFLIKFNIPTGLRLNSNWTDPLNKIYSIP